LKLADAVQAAIYKERNIQDDPKDRNFYHEAQEKLPRLYREIEKHNAKARKVREAKSEKVNTYERNKKDRQIAFLGTDAQCDALVKKYRLTE
jgi:hypothetical protein